MIGSQNFIEFLEFGGHLGKGHLSQSIHRSGLANMDFHKLETLRNILSYVGNCYFICHIILKNKPLSGLLLLDYKRNHYVISII